MDAFDQSPIETRPVPWKPIAIIVGAAVLCVLLIVGVSAFVKNRNAAAVKQQLVEEEHVDVQERRSLRCANAADKASCEAHITSQSARSFKDASLCESLSGDGLDGCLLSVAFETRDANLCKKIENASRKASCLTSITHVVAAEEGDASVCSAIEEPGARANCEFEANGPITEANCSARGYDDSYCMMIIRSKEAKAAKNPDLCLSLGVQEYILACQDHVPFVDRDGDGLEEETEIEAGSSDRSVDTDDDTLSDADELRRYGTDPANPDTDEDGFSDGDEVRAGYDPNGPGRLGE